MSWKRSSGRSSGQPEAADCSGKAGMVAGGARWRGWVWTVAGSGLGKMGRADNNAGGRWNMAKRKVKKNVRAWDMVFGMRLGGVSVCVLSEGIENIWGSVDGRCVCACV